MLPAQPISVQIPMNAREPVGTRIVVEKPAVRLLFLSSSLDRGGSERFLYVLLSRLDPRLYEVHLALLQQRGCYLAQLPAHVRVHQIPGGRLRYSLPGLVGLIAAIRPTIVVSTLAGLNSFGVIARGLALGVRPAIVVREGTVTKLSEPWLVNRRITDALIGFAYRRADVVVANSSYLKGRIVDDYDVPAARVRVINNPVAVSPPRELSDELAEPMRRWLEGDAFRIIAVGNLKPAKAYERMLAVLAGVHRAGQRRFKALVLGDDYCDFDLPGRVRALGLDEHVFWHPFYASPHDLVRAADLYMMTSIFEGFPNALAESVACGTPVVAFDAAGGFRDIVLPGVNGVLLPDGDIAAMTAAVIDCIDGQRRFDSDAVTASARRWSAEAILPRFDELFAELAQARSPRSSWSSVAP